MSNKTEKPYVLRAAEFVYTNIIEIKKQNPEINNIQAFEIFMTKLKKLKSLLYIPLLKVNFLLLWARLVVGNQH